jgi:glycosyltransferase involved in cell wall biosynthesis
MKKLLIIGFVWPEPTSTAAGTRMIQLIELFKKNNYEITFASTASKSDNSYDLDSLNISTKNILLNDTSFDQFVKELNPSIVMFDRFLTEEQFGWRIAENCPDALRILDTEDLHFLRNARIEAYKKQLPFSFEILFSNLAKRELASIYRCDITLIISKYEFKLLKKTFKINKSLLLYIPFLLDPIDKKKIFSYPTFEERKDFISIGNFKHEPNWNAVLNLKNNIWPIIKQKLPKAKMLIYGSYASEKVFQLNNEKENFIIKGWAESTEEVFKTAKVCLAPIEFGAGLKGKLIDAMKFGTPSVTTSIGSEAMHGKLPWNGFIEDDINNFCNRAVTLYSNKDVWEKSQQNSVEIINDIYSKKKFEKRLFLKINSVLTNLEKHRLKNITGSILQHHSLKSTKYLSKWIEEKNKS